MPSHPIINEALSAAVREGGISRMHTKRIIRAYLDAVPIDSDEMMAQGALNAIQTLLDDVGIPQGTFADDQVRNLVALYNRRGDRIKKLKAARSQPSADLVEVDVEQAAKEMSGYSDDGWERLENAHKDYWKRKVSSCAKAWGLQIKGEE